MIHQMFVVHDSAAAAYLNPYCQWSDATALRQFTEMVNDPNHPFSKTPQDYTVFKIGQYDDETAEVKTLQAYEKLANGIEVRTHDA